MRSQEQSKANIFTSEVNAKLAFMNFEEVEKSRLGQETFEDKLKRVSKQFTTFKSLIEQKQQLDSSNNTKSEVSPHVIAQLETIQGRLDYLLENNSSSGEKVDSRVESIIRSMKHLTQNQDDEQTLTDNVTYELMYNNDSSNILVAAKLSELKKRMDRIQKTLGDYNSTKHVTIGEMLRSTEDKLKLISNDKQMSSISNVPIY